jgi:hypothetical protein
MDALEAMNRESLLSFSDIQGTEELKKVLEANIKNIDEQIIKLALSDKADDNSERLKLLGIREFAFNLLSRIK